MPSEPLTAPRQQALRWLARREYSHFELQQRLLHRFPEHASAIDQTLQELVDKNWLSDERFTASRVKLRIQQGYGPQRIQAELRQLGISHQLIARWLPAPEDDCWLPGLKRLCQKSLRSEPAHKLEAKQRRYLERRGYTPEQIQQLKV